VRDGERYNADVCIGRLFSEDKGRLELIVAGYLVWIGRLRWAPVLAVGIISAVIGDNAGYWIGRRYGGLASSVLRRAEDWSAPRAEGFVARYGALAVFLARFIAGLRVLAGPLSGAMGLPFGRFFVANLCGAMLFIPYAVAIGYGIAYGLRPYVDRLHHILGGVERVVLIIVVVLVGSSLGRHAVWPRLRRMTGHSGWFS
jgi:membrane-associated protein